MCHHCWTGHGKPALDDVDILATALLVGRLYDMPGCSTGGPLHWMLDDMNLDDEQFGQDDPLGYRQGLFAYLDDGRFDQWASASPAEKAHIRHLSEAILAQLADMPEGWRAAVIAWREGWIAADMPEYAARARTQERMERVEEYAEELLDKARALPPIDERGYNAPPESKACVPVPCPSFQDVRLSDYYAPLFANGPTVLLADVPEDLRPLAEQYIQEHAPRFARPDELPDGDAIHRFTEEFTARGGVMALSNEGRIDLRMAATHRGLVDGVIHPGPGLKFAPDADMRGPFQRATVNPDGSATLHGLGLHEPPLVGNAPEGAPTFAWAHYTVTADGRTESAYWNAADLAAITEQPEIDMAEVLAPTLPKITYRHEENAKE